MKEILTNRIKLTFNNMSNFKVYKLSFQIDDYNDYEKRTKFFRLIKELYISIENDFFVSKVLNKATFIFLVQNITLNKSTLNEHLDENILKELLNLCSNQYFYELDLNSDEIPNLLLLGMSMRKNINNKYSDFYSDSSELLSYVKMKGKMCICLAFSIKDSILSANVKTFSKEKNNPTYVFKNGYMLPLKGKFIKDEDGYVLRTRNKEKKNKLAFLNPSNYTSFTECKMFRMWELIEDFNQFYNGICEINFQTSCMESRTFSSVKNATIINKIQRKLIEEKLNIIDACNESKFIEQIYEWLRGYGVDNIIKNNELLKDYLNLRLIHDKKTYLKKGQVDQHITTSEYILNHITIENSFKNKEILIDNSMYVILSELLIKKDIFNQKLSLYNDLDFFHNYMFILGVSKGKGVSLQIKNKDLIFDEIENTMISSEQEYLFEINSKTLIPIEETDERPIIRLNEIQDAFRSFRAKKPISVFMPYLEKAKLHYPNSIILKWIEDLADGETEVIFSDFYDEVDEMINNIVLSDERERLRKELTAINKYISKISDRNVFIKNPFWRTLSDNAPLIGFHYNFSDTGLCYYSGVKKSLSNIVPNGFVVRKIKKIFNSEDLDGFFQTLDVDNIRYNQNTLVPFPFKYLREYIEIKK